ncbi:MAG: hypothetical protein WKF84_20365 [Pyrinomonadaceae bacterium]
MRTRILTHRNDLPLLQSCQPVLTDILPIHLRPYLVEALFDYRPAEWYRPATAVNPPKRTSERRLSTGCVRLAKGLYRR